MAADKNPFAKFLTHFEKGHVLFHEGDAGEDMFIIQSGKVAIKKRVKEGGDATLAILEKGDFFGEMALLERLPRSATAEVIEDGDLIVIGGGTPVDLTNEDQSRNISRRHARLVIKDGAFFIAEEIGTMNGTFLNGKKLSNGVLTPIKDGDELILCRLALSFKSPATMNRQ